MKEITEWLHSLDGISNIIAVDKLAHWIWVFFRTGIYMVV